MAEIIVRESTLENVVKVNSTIVEFDAQYTSEYFAERYGDKEHLIIVAWLDDYPIGYIVGYDKFSDGSFYCWMAGVDPKFRGRGVLTSMMNYFVDWTKQKGYKKIKIKTRNNKRSMLSYLVKEGYMFTEVIPYPDILESRINLEKEL